MRFGVIYKITSPNGKIYIGQTVQLDIRKIHYKNLHCKKQCKIYNSISKYGWSDHSFEIIEQIGECELNQREQYWINFYDSFNNGLNLTTGGDSPKRSEESNKKISESKKGEKNWMYGRKGKLHHNFGKKSSDETIKKLKDSHLGKMTGKDNPNYKGDIEVYKDGILIGIYESSNLAAQALNVIAANIRKALRGERKTVGGYKFIRI